MSFGESLRYARQRHSMTLRAFARQVKISASFCSDIELGRRYPSETVLVRMKSVLHSHARLLEDVPRCPTCGTLWPSKPKKQT